LLVPAEGEDHVGLADAPGVRELARRRRLAGVALGAAAGHPRQQGGAVLLAQAAVVGPFAVPGVGVPGRHAVVADDLLDHVGPGQGVLEGQQRHWADLAGPVALLAVLLDHGGDVLAVGDDAVAGRLADAGDEAAGRRRPRHADGPPGQHIV